MTKAHILSEIKRTAEANEGVPLGMKAFRAETGIKISDWRGKYWARWGDALIEAGLDRNQLQQAYEEAELLESYAKLALELGRLPIVPEMQLNSRRGFAIPEWGTFKRRFGDKSSLVRKVLEYCQGHPTFAGVIPLCEGYIPSRHDQLEVSETPSTREDSVGYVYLVKHGSRREYRIGSTVDPLRREGELRVQLPERLLSAHVITTDDRFGIEAYWHKRFEAKNKNGDWFELDASDVAAFKRRTFM